MKVHTYEVGKTYCVMVLPIGSKIDVGGQTVTFTHWEGFTGDLPILTPFSIDEPFIKMEDGKPTIHHVHVDWRFLDDFSYCSFLGRLGEKNLQGKVMLMPVEFAHFLPRMRQQWKWLKCLRQAPDGALGHGAWLGELEKSACGARLAGKCPHRGTPSEAMIHDGHGNLICPAHGLRFNERTGALNPRVQQ